jgi:hypothetical protein
MLYEQKWENSQAIIYKLLAIDIYESLVKSCAQISTKVLGFAQSHLKALGVEPLDCKAEG